MKPDIHPALNFKKMIIRRFSVRFHMFVILTAVITFGLVLSRILRMTGLTSLTIRSAVVLLLSYIFFFIAIRIWLFYVLPSFRRKEQGSGSGLSAADIDGFVPSGIPAGESPGGSIPQGGGLFSGGGGSGNWNSGAAAVVINDSSMQAAPIETAGISSGGSDSAKDLFSLGDLDIDSAGALVILLIFLVIAAMLGGAVYIIYQAPVILSEAAFNALLSGGMVKASKQMRSEDWTGSVFKATWLPFAIITAITIGAAAILAYVFPGETNITDIVRHTVLK